MDGWTSDIYKERETKGARWIDPIKKIRTLHGGQVQINKLLNKRCYGTKVTTQRKRKKSHIYIYIY
jgi:hypothetical protein